MLIHRFKRCKNLLKVVHTDMDTNAIFSRGDKVYDRNKQHVKYYKEVPAVLEKLKSLRYELGIASRSVTSSEILIIYILFYRTSATKEAEDLLRLFNWNQYFSYKQIYPGTKTTHINRICKDSNSAPANILFFDDESRNIRDLSAINVCSILVHDGVTMEVVRKGIQIFVETSKK